MVGILFPVKNNAVSKIRERKIKIINKKSLDCFLNINGTEKKPKVENININ